jgi:hypothetical protein
MIWTEPVELVEVRTVSVDASKQVFLETKGVLKMGARSALQGIPRDTAPFPTHKGRHDPDFFGALKDELSISCVDSL